MVSGAMQQPSQQLFTFDTIGSRFWIEDLAGKQIPVTVQKQITAYVNAFDDKYSRFKPGSLVSELAANGTLHNPPSELIAMLALGKLLYDATNGVFNVTVGAALSGFGYGSKHTGDKVFANPWGAITWSKKTVKVPKGLVLDFGGLGKGWLIDRIAEILRKNGIKRFIVNGGGDLYIQNTQPVEFALEDPLAEGKVLQTVRITQGALAGSNTLKRSWDSHGVRKHHIINPKTGDSSDGDTIASYVLADSAVIADSLATVLIIDPTQKDSLEQQFRLKALLIKRPL